MREEKALGSLLLTEACLLSGVRASSHRVPRVGWGTGATYIQAGHVHPVAHNHIDELIRGAVLSEEHLRIEDL